MYREEREEDKLENYTKRTMTLTPAQSDLSVAWKLFLSQRSVASISAVAVTSAIGFS